MKTTSRKKLFHIIALFAIIIALITLGYIFRNQIFYFISLLKDGDKLKDYLNSFGYFSGLVFLLFQILQVVIFFIPGEVIQAAGGYVFGTFYGTFLSLLGIAIGSFFLFLISAKLGRNFVKRYVSAELHSKIEKMLNKKRRNIVVFFLYLIPGGPKDCLVMICALTDISVYSFMIYSMLGRIPALFLSTFIGANLGKGKFIEALLITLACLSITIITIFNREKLINILTKSRKRKQVE